MTAAELVDQAVIEAARSVMASQLRLDRAAGDDQAVTVRTWEMDAALQELRDSCAAQSRVRVRR